MDQIWLASPSAAMRLWPGRPKASWRLNPAALSWGRRVALNEATWHAVAAELSAAHAGGGAGEGRLDAVGARWRSLPMSTGWLVWLAVDDARSPVRPTDPTALNDTFADAIRLAQIGVWRIDIEQRWMELNDVGFHMLGLGKGAGRVSLDAVRACAHPDDVAAMASAAAEALTRDAVVDLESRYRIPGTTEYRRVLTRRVAQRDADGRATGLLGVSLEQTERMAERDRAQSAAQRIERVADTAGVGVYSVDLHTGDVQWNRQMFRIHGLPETDAPPRFDEFVTERVHPDDRARFTAGRLTFAGEQEGFEGEIRVVHPNGSVHWVEYRSHKDRLGAGWLVFGIAIDVTERVAERAVAERSLREKEAAERASASKSELLARMSHELRTPLNAVLGFARLIQQDGSSVPAEVLRLRIGHIRQAGETLLAVVSQVLDRVEPVHAPPADAVAPSPAPSSAAEATPDEPLPQPSTDGRPSPASAARGPLSTLTILYIEDNPVNVVLVEQLVAMRPDTVLHCAGDGRSGVAWAAAHTPDVILVDMHLPDVDGFEVLRCLRELPALGRSAIVALSANGISEDIALALEAGFDDYWTKPIDFRLFLTGLDKLAADR